MVWAVNGMERAPSGALSVSAGRILGFDAGQVMVDCELLGGWIWKAVLLYCSVLSF